MFCRSDKARLAHSLVLCLCMHGITTDDTTFQLSKYLVGPVTNVAMTCPSPLGSYSKNLLARHCHCNVGLFSIYYRSMTPKSMCKPL